MHTCCNQFEQATLPLCACGWYRCWRVWCGPSATAAPPQRPARIHKAAQRASHTAAGGAPREGRREGGRREGGMLLVKQCLRAYLLVYVCAGAGAGAGAGTETGAWEMEAGKRMGNWRTFVCMLRMQTYLLSSCPAPPPCSERFLAYCSSGATQHSHLCVSMIPGLLLLLSTML